MKGKTLVWIIGIAFLVGGMALSIGAPTDAREARLIAEKGVETTATITEARIRTGGRFIDRHAVFDVEFKDEFGLDAEASGLNYCGEPDSKTVGDKIEILYDPDNTEVVHFKECPQSQAITIPLMIGIFCVALGTVGVLWAWRAVGWKRRWVGAIIVVVGILFAGTSLQPDCNCFEMIYFSGALLIIGAVPLVAPRRSDPIGPPTAPA